MGDPRRLRKKYVPPAHPWEKGRIEEENKLIKGYGLKNKREIWGMNALLKKYRRIAGELVGVPKKERKEKEKKLLEKLQKMGVLEEGATLDDVLSLRVNNFLERRLQTIVWKKGMAYTAKQARQLITHGHIKVKGQKSTAPGMLVNKDDEKLVSWYGKPVVEKPVAAEAEAAEEVQE